MANAIDIKQLIKRRGTLKAQITSFRTFLSRYDEEQLIDRARISTCLTKFKETFANFDAICDQLDILERTKRPHHRKNSDARGVSRYSLRRG